MKHSIATSLGIICIFSMITFPQESFAGQCDTLKPGQAAFFQHGNYKGACVVRGIGRYASGKAIGIGNDKISSIKLGARTQVRLCNDSNFRGGCKTYTNSTASLGKMNDKTSSAIIETVPPPTGAALSKCTPGANQVAFFQHAQYQGACTVRRVGRYANAQSIGIGNDKISSVKIGSGTQVVLCKDNNFKGCTTYAQSTARLGRMNDKTSSAIIVRTVPQKAPPYVPENSSTPSRSNTEYQCDDYGICICKGETACLSMSQANGPCVTNKNNEPVLACDTIACACYKSGSNAAIANPSSLCDAEGVVSMNGVIEMNGRVLTCSHRMKYSDTVFGPKTVYQATPEEEVPTEVVSPQNAPPYRFEKH